MPDGDSYAIQTRAGVVRARIRGCGGMLAGPGGRQSLARNIRLASRGRPLDIPSPRPGHAMAADGRAVDLAGARLLEPDPDP